VPAECTLPNAQQPLCVAEFNELFSSAVRGLDRPERGRLSLELDPLWRSRPVRRSLWFGGDLVVRETKCCSFLAFALTVTGGQLVLEVVVPPAHIAVLDALAASAATGMSGSGPRRRS
jgi:hypothetical protein